MRTHFLKNFNHELDWREWPGYDIFTHSFLVRWQSGPLQRFAKPHSRRFESGPHLMILGIDYGKKKIGIAYSEGITASPLGSITNAPTRLVQLKELIQSVNQLDQPIQTIVIGLPNSPLDQEIKQFASELADYFQTTTIFEDEFNSTQEAFQAMLDSGISRKKRRKDDSNAATTILQRYLDNKALN